jgi:1-deoxy-D-xylulose-5-phosphate reductoisomerase
MTAVLNAANEVAVESFLSGKIPFSIIPAVVQSTMEKHETRAHPGMEDVLEADRWAREMASEFVAQTVHSR